MGYIFTSEELDEITLAVAAVSSISDQTLGKYRPVYDLIYDILTNNEGYYIRPVEGLETNVWTWVSGAMQVNSNQGYSAYYIREYTRSQYEQRYGITLSDTDLNIASNTIAENFINDILTGETPTIEELGLIDAAPIAGSIFDEVFSENYAGWSGTMLFPFLGIDSYFRDWILSDTPVNSFKPLGGTYDLISATAATIPLADNALSVVRNFYDTFGIIGTINAAEKSQQLKEETNAFIEEVYEAESYQFSLHVGDDLFQLGSKSANYVVGTLLDDTYSMNPAMNKAVNGTDGNDVINAGLGDDVVFASAGEDLIDGDEGDDTIDSGEGDDLIISGLGADKIIVGQGEDTITDGSSADRLFIRASTLGGSLVEGQDRLIPLLGGINTYVTLQDFSGTPQVDVEKFYDADGDGNNEYWFSSVLLRSVATSGGQAIALGQDLFEKYNLDPFAIVYEMHEGDLIISIYKGHSVIPPFTGRPLEELLPKDIHLLVEPTAKVTLANYSQGDFGITFEGPHEIGTINVDGDSFKNASVLELHNNYVATLTNNGNLNETLGEMVTRAPLEDGQTGEPGEIVIKTGEEDDTYIGDETDENIKAEAGDDIIDGAGGDDVIDGGTGEDIISGGSGENSLKGGPGNDIFLAGIGFDEIEGGAGEDMVDYSGSAGPVLINLGTGQITGGDAENDQLNGVEGISGTVFNDTLIGSELAETLIGNQGADTISGYGGDDILDGGEGADIIDGGDGFDQVSYESSTEGVTVDLINQLATGGNALGDQLSNIEGVVGSHLTDTLIGSDFANHLQGKGGDDAIFAAGGDDRIEGGAGADTLDGGDGIDTLDYSSSQDGVSVDLATGSVSGGDATGDIIAGFENIIGSALSDNLKGDENFNFIDAGDGDDTITVTPGADILLGGYGYDTLDFKEAATSITVDLASATFEGSLASGIEAFSFENISGSDFDDTITGTNGANFLAGGTGQDTVKGGGGDDVIDGGAGNADIAQFTGNRADYIITQYTNGALRVEDQRTSPAEATADGTDIVSNIEFFEFADQTLDFANLALANAAPIALDETGPDVMEETTITFTSSELLANDQDFDGDSLSIIAVGAAPDGEVVLKGNGDIEFTPAFNFYGNTYFEYIISDGISAPQTARVTLAVINQNDAPIALDDTSLNIYADVETTIKASDLLANDFEFDNDQVTIVSVNPIAGGTVNLTQEGDVLFAPTGAIGETAAFSYTIEDPSGFSSTAFVQTNLVESQPFTAIEDQYTTSENQAITLLAEDLLDNDLNEASLPPVITGVSGAFNGSVVINLAGDIVFKPEVNFFGTAGFTYHVDNLEGGMDSADVTIIVEENLENAPPLAVDDGPINIVEDTIKLIESADLLANDTDPDGNPLTIIEVNGATGGAVQLLANGVIEFTPDANYNGPAAFTYTVSDGNGGVDTASVNLNITPVNDAPLTADDNNINILEDQVAIIAATDLLANDTDPDGDDLVITSVGAAVNGAVNLLVDGDVEFTPAADYNGPASFTYTVSDGNGGEAVATANLIIGAVNDAPIADDDTGLQATEDQSEVILAADLLLNDSDIENDTLVITSVSGAVNGSVTLLAGGDVEFTPAADYNGPASFIYTISDGNGGEATATANLTISAVNDAPTSIGLSSIDIAENSPGGAIVGTLSVSDVDQGDSAVYTITGGTGADKFVINGSNLEVAANADLDYEQSPSFTLEIEAVDNGGLSTTQTFDINLLDIEEGGVIEGTSLSDTLTGTAEQDTILGLAGNDIINAGAGDDTLVGGSGADALDGGDGADTVNYSGSTSGVVIILTTFLFRPYGIGIGGEATGDTLINIENIVGSDFSDTLIGNAEDNELSGGAGNDYLLGAGGRDQFIFKEGYGRDTILDFESAGPASEKITLEFDGISSYEDLEPLISPLGFFQSSTRIDFTSGDRLTLLGVNPNELDADNFDFL